MTNSMKKYYRISLSILLLFFFIGINTPGCSKDFGSNKYIKHFLNSINHANESTDLGNSLALKNSNSLTINYMDLEGVVQLRKKALYEAKLVDINLLNKDLEGFGDHYRDEFIKGLELYIEGWEHYDRDKFITGQILLDKWGSWYSQNLKIIRSL